MQMLDMELNRLQSILDSATVIEPLPKGKKKTVTFGCPCKVGKLG